MGVTTLTNSFDSEVLSLVTDRRDPTRVCNREPARLAGVSTNHGDPVDRVDFVDGGVSRDPIDRTDLIVISVEEGIRSPTAIHGPFQTGGAVEFRWVRVELCH